MGGFFFSELDPRAAIKGSRDPLGVQAEWARLGRELVGNLTTVTQSVRGFTTLLLGLHLAQQAAEDGERTAEKAFLVWEQIAGYARYCFHDVRGLLGYRRIVARTQLGHAVLSADADGQILGNQKAYGLWGLYISAARASGLVTGNTTPRLEEVAHRHVTGFLLPALRKEWGRDAKALVALLREDGKRIEIRKDNARLRAIAAILDPRLTPDEAAFYRKYLIEGGPDDRTAGRQRKLAATMQRLDTDFVPELAAAAEPEVAEHLHRIAAAESVLAPAAALFGYVLTREDALPDEIALDVRDTWGDRLESVDPKASQVLGGSWSAIANGLSDGEYTKVLSLLLARNRDVMAHRGNSAAWASIGESGRIAVRFRDDIGKLPSHDEVRMLWRNPYFLPSLHSVAKAVEGEE